MIIPILAAQPEFPKGVKLISGVNTILISVLIVVIVFAVVAVVVVVSKLVDNIKIC
jgi:choline-glycine betaine transporter